jgi:hypothetical protein
MEEFGMEAKLYVGNLSYRVTEQRLREERGGRNHNQRRRY